MDEMLTLGVYPPLVNARTQESWLPIPNPIVVLATYGTCQLLHSPSNTHVQSSLPIYKAGGAGTWMWLVLPLFLYLMERLYRFYMSQARPLRVVKVVKHHDATPVIQVNLTKVPTVVRQQF